MSFTTNPQPRPIGSYSYEEVQDIVLLAIRKQSLGPGYYYDTDSGQTLKIERYSDAIIIVQYTYANMGFQFTYDMSQLTLNTKVYEPLTAN